MEYNKLVRDNIPKIINNKGEKAITRIADDKEYEEALANKLHEEVGKFLSKPSVEETADILEVLTAICDSKGVDLTTLEKTRKNAVVLKKELFWIERNKRRLQIELANVVFQNKKNVINEINMIL